jgi:hypothetical protein
MICRIRSHCIRNAHPVVVDLGVLEERAELEVVWKDVNEGS